MKTTIIRLARITVCILCISHQTYAMFSLYGKSILVPRSSTVNAARDLVASHRFMYEQYDRNDVYGNFSITPQYAHSFRTNRLAEYFFSVEQLNITGSQVEDRGDNDLLADYFGLSPRFNSVVCPRPEIEYALVTFDWFLGYRNFFFRAIAPIGWTKWEVCLQEEIICDGTGTPFPALYMDQASVQPPASSFNEAIKGVRYGQIQPLAFGKIDGAQKQGGASDLLMMLGWFLVRKPDSHVEIHLRSSAPTGNRPDPEYFFTPILGNGHHWELGLGLSGHVRLWEEDNEQFLNLYVTMDGTYLFKSNQVRSFDLVKNRQCDTTNAKFGSRYILAKTFDVDGNYTGVTVPSINATTLNCDVHADVQLDIVFMFSYERPHTCFDFGYNAWVKSQERIDITDCCNAYANTGLKGIQNVTQMLPPFLIPTTESTATLHGAPFADQAILTDPNSPVLLKERDINLSSAETGRQFTHKIFVHFNYLWDPRETITPYFGAGGQVEFEGIRPSDIPSFNNTLSLWSVWIKGGFGY